MIAALLLFACVQAAQPGTPPAPSNVLVIIADDLGWSEMPYLESVSEIADRGVTFSRAYGFPICSPSRYAALYGRWPRRADIGDLCGIFAPTTSPAPDFAAEVSLAEAMTPHRRTALFGKWHLAGGIDAPRWEGFDVYRAGSIDSINKPSGSGHYDWHRTDDGIVTEHANDYATDEQAQAFIAWWGGSDKFAVVSFSAPHFPYEEPGGTLRDRYLAGVARMDAAIFALLGEVDWTSTVVVFFADNGTPNDARPNDPAFRWKGTTYEGGINVPLVIGGAGITASGTSQRLVSLVDIPATLMEVAGVEPDLGFNDSASFANALGGWTGTTARSWVFSERYDAPADDQAVIEAVWKLRVYDSDGPGFVPAQTKLYQLPDETTALDPASYPTEYARLLGHLSSLPPRP